MVEAIDVSECLQSTVASKTHWPDVKDEGVSARDTTAATVRCLLGMGRSSRKERLNEQRKERWRCLNTVAALSTRRCMIRPSRCRDRVWYIEF